MGLVVTSLSSVTISSEKNEAYQDLRCVFRHTGRWCDLVLLADTSPSSLGSHTTVLHGSGFKASLADIGASRWLSSILAGRFLLHIRSAASRRNASSGSQYSDSQSAADTASLETRSWISSVEFIVDIGDDNDQTCNADLFSDDEDANVQEQDEEPVAMSVTQC
ncbi:hypothetical protein POSPLADRAFT_1046261 [Postia placenta MAD-698-R-SB12]|uniref:Uncharacterized protein n=1 Tax=Postia placenta MAD-698-R-SB12 TaxID=670580 RepID=A0A1X6N2X6_9APHY|nr:hypothetical protein POSPLADRAFT_1046261 [Postia placenta MAD-698-R-SB12]OSX62870.1 hypothetical protein POSPLADRAFT_1046261 [Postia placenta MAD-698-R-SB12]